MPFASILILGSIILASAGEDQPPPSHLAGQGAVEASWQVPPRPSPGGERRPSILFEEDEDDTFDDAPLDSGFASGSHAPALTSAQLLAGFGPGRVTSRSSAPTLRMRC